MNDETPQKHGNDEEKINYNTPEYGYGNTSELQGKLIVIRRKKKIH